MSFRELRNFTEIMRSLGYPRLISVENFRTPNFQLVADTLFWLVQRYDPNVTLTDVIDSEDDRVTFLTSIARVMMSKANIKLNTKRLYAADGRAVKELLKVASMLYEAAVISGKDAAAGGGDSGADPVEAAADSMPLSAKFRDLKQARSLAREITDRGARLHDLLEQEPTLREARLKALRFLEGADADGSYVDRALREIISSVQENVTQLEQQCSELENDERNLDAKIKRKQADLERSEKRLKSLQSVRPAFMDEYEKLEEELKRQYDVYLERFRNLDYLEHELDQTREAERATISQSDRQIERRKQREMSRQLNELRGDDDEDGPRRPDGSAGGDRGGSSRGGDRAEFRGDRGDSRGGGSRGSSRGGRGGGGGGGDRDGGSGGSGGGASSRKGPRQQGSLLGPGSGSDSDSLSSTGSDSLSDDEEVSLGGSSAGSGSFRSDGSGSGSDLISDDESEHSDF